MESVEIDIGGKWTVDVLFVPETEDDFAVLVEAMESVGSTEEDIAETCKLLSAKWNKGATSSSGWQRRSVVVIGKATSWKQFFDSILHEVEHVVSDICLWYDIQQRGEPPAYLQGWIGRGLAEMVRQFACG